MDLVRLAGNDRHEAHQIWVRYESMGMRKAVIFGPGDLRVINEPYPEPSEREVRVKVLYSSICGTDVKYYLSNQPPYNTAPYPRGVGHDCSGIVDKVGAGVTKFKVGDEVVPTRSSRKKPCGVCRSCRKGRYRACVRIDSTATVQSSDPKEAYASGEFQEYIVLKEEDVYKIPKGATLIDGAIDEPFPAALLMAEIFNYVPEENLLVFGAGQMGLGQAHVAKRLYGLKVAVVDIVDKRLDLAKKLGADYTFNPRHGEISEWFRSLWPEGPQYVAECAGSDATCEWAMELAGIGTKVGIVGGGIHPLSSNLVLQKSLEVYGIKAPDYSGRHPLEYIAQGKLDLKPEISHRFELSRVKEALDLLIQAPDEATKIVLEHKS